MQHTLIHGPQNFLSVLNAILLVTTDYQRIGTPVSSINVSLNPVAENEALERTYTLKNSAPTLTRSMQDRRMLRNCDTLCILI